jgi:hypothetical protein
MRTNSLVSQGGTIDVTTHFALMHSDLTALERAFDLARSGKCHNIMDIYLQLRAEGYSLDQLEGPLLKSQLRHLIEVAVKRNAPRK